MRGEAISRSGAADRAASDPIPPSTREGRRRFGPVGPDFKNLGAVFCPSARGRGESNGRALDTIYTTLVLFV